MLQTAKLNKSVKIERKSNSELMAASSKISRVYVQANYEKDKQCVYLKFRVRDETKNFVE